MSDRNAIVIVWWKIFAFPAFVTIERRASEYRKAASAKSCRRSISKPIRTCSRCGKQAGSVSPRMKRPSSAHSSSTVALMQPVRVGCRQLEAKHRPQCADLLQGWRAEGCLALEGVQD